MLLDKVDMAVSDVDSVVSTEGLAVEWEEVWRIWGSERTFPHELRMMTSHARGSICAAHDIPRTEVQPFEEG